MADTMMMTDVIENKLKSTEQDLKRIAYLRHILKGKEIQEVAVRLQNLPSWANDVEHVHFYTMGKHSPIDITVTLKKTEDFPAGTDVHDCKCSQCWHRWTVPVAEATLECPQCADRNIRMDEARPARTGSTLPREIVLAGLATRLDKTKSYDGSSIRIHGKLFPNRKWRTLRKGVTIDITGYVPQTCKIEYEEVFVPARMEKRTKIVCGPESSAEAKAAVEAETVLAPITADTLDA